MNEIIKIAIADPSVIVRSGIVVTLKRISSMKIHPVEIAAPENLQYSLRMNRPDVLIINPAYLGYFDADKIRDHSPKTKLIALIYSPLEQSLLKQYDETISINDSVKQIHDKLMNVLHRQPEENSQHQPLSQREQEIIICVVKGMTNKEIADQLFLSNHTIITHRRNIAKKLQIHSPAGLTIYAIVNNLVQLEDIQGSIE
jgi:DNA-binding NarL/FixJ family response regulator